MGEGTATGSQVRRRRIIERPRLTRLLDESQGRIKMLVAPAGYGKTTLARQWLEGKSSSWYRGSPASSDIAALAAGLGRAASLHVPNAGATMLERLSVTSRPDEEPDVLAGMLAADLAAWPRNGWFVFDDYHTIDGASPAERFVEALLLATHVNILVVSRCRPRWASARRLLYGEVFELDRTVLAMTDEEARQLLGDGSGQAAELVDSAQGWPAVLALASVSKSSTPPVVTSSHLYAFFADELYQRVDPETRRALCELALYDAGGRSFVLRGLPRAEATRLVAVGVANGFLTELSDGTLDMHPLLRSFLEQKLREELAESTPAVVARAARTLIQQQLWDEAFDLIDRYQEYVLVPELVGASMDSMLALGRTTTLRRWVECAPQDAPPVRLASAELSFREGHFHESEALATLAALDAPLDHELSARALLAAGRAAHAASRESVAADLYANALDRARNEDIRRIAVLGMLGAAIELERPEAVSLLESLGPVDVLEPDERVILVSRMINLETRFALPISVEAGRAMWQLLPRVRDPVMRASFRNVFGYTLAAMGYSEEALSLTLELLEEADRFRLAFVIPYALTNQALIRCGLREYAVAAELLDTAEDHALRSGDQTAFHIAWAVRIRLYNAQGAFDLAVSRALPRECGQTRSLQAELLASYAVAFAGQGELGRARGYANRAHSMSRAAETAISSPCALAVAAINEGDHSAGLQHAKTALEVATGCGMIESFVSAYRGCPEIVVSLMSDPAVHDDLSRVLATARDENPVPGAGSRRSIFALSPREKEVLALLAQGLSNPAIGERLFISPVTVKVHVRHIFEKLGVHSRAEAALRAAQLGRQATPPPPRGRDRALP